MAFTRIDCQFFSPEYKGLPSSYVALNPNCQPGSLVLAGTSAVTHSIGAQVACKLSLEHFVSGVLDFFDSSEFVSLEERGVSQMVLEAAFRRANTSVYDFGHKLAAGGRLAASLLGIVIEDSTVAAGRVGSWSAFLIRDGVVFPFFEDQHPAERVSEDLDGEFVGSRSLVTIDTAIVPIQAADSLLVFSEVLTEIELTRLTELIGSDDPLSEQNDWICEKVFTESENQPLILSARVGPDSIYLAEVADDNRENL